MAEISREQFRALPREQKLELAQEAQKAAFRKLPREQKIEMIKQKAAKQAQSAQPQQIDPNQVSPGQAARIGIEQGATLGFRPAVAGAGAALGAGVGTIQQGGGLLDAIRAGKGAFFEGRGEAREEQERAARQQPGASLGGQLAGGALTLPLTAVKGLAGAAKLGATVGAGEAASEAETLGEIPGKIAKGATVGIATEGALKGVGAVAKGAKKIIGNLETTKAIKKAVTNTATKLSEAATGVPKQIIKTFAKEGDEVTKIIKRSKGEVTDEVTKWRESIVKGVESKRREASKSIGKELAGPIGDKKVNANPFIDKIDEVIKGLDPNINKDEIRAINKLSENIIAASDKQGQVSLRQVQILKRKADEIAKSTFAAGGIVAPVSQAQKRAARAVGDLARKKVRELAPTTKEANVTLSKLRALEKKAKILLGEDKPIRSAIGIGSGTNRQNEKIIESIGKITGKDHVSDIQKISAAKVFGEAKLLSLDTTGKGLERAGKAALLAGASTGSLTASVIAGLATNPATLKTAIRSGQVTSKIAKSIFKKGNAGVKSLLIQQFGQANFTDNKEAIKRRNKRK